MIGDRTYSQLETDHLTMQLNLCKSGSAILADLTDDKVHLLHMAVGVAGEAGELLDAIKKIAVYNKPIDMENIIEELGDIEFYLTGIRTRLGISRYETLFHNLKKLGKRYQAGYSDKAAQERADKNPT